MNFFDPREYTVKDLFFWGGLMAGVILVYFVSTPFELHPLIRVGAGILVGAGLGWGLERGYAAATRRRPPDPPKQP